METIKSVLQGMTLTERGTGVFPMKSEWVEPSNIYGIPPRFKNASFDNYDLKEGSQQLEIFNILKGYQWPQNIILIGGVGTGKTHLTCALLNTLKLPRCVEGVEY